MDHEKIGCLDDHIINYFRDYFFKIGQSDSQDMKAIGVWINGLSWSHCLWDLVLMHVFREEFIFRFPILLYLFSVMHVNIKAIWAAVILVLISLFGAVTSAYIWSIDHAYGFAFFCTGMMMNFLIFYEFLILVSRGSDGWLKKVKLLIQPIMITIITHMLANLFIIFIIKAIIKPLPE